MKKQISGKHHTKQSADRSQLDSQRRSKQECREIFEQDILPLRNEIYGMIARAAKSREDAEKVYQQTFEAIWMALPTLKSRDVVRGWAFRIVRNHIYDYYRNESKPDPKEGWMEVPFSECEEADLSEDNILIYNRQNYADILEFLLREEEYGHLMEDFEKLDGLFKRIFILRHIDRKSMKEIAAELSLNYNTVRSYYHRGMKKWKRLAEERMRGDSDEDGK